MKSLVLTVLIAAVGIAQAGEHSESRPNPDPAGTGQSH